ncbi:NAD(P)H-binding protein [Novipirellula sp. SH528]|uniref:NAD(P)H-binding protein n=1 Tax=Novipirellula sp. SH528 TaxID=3454466 RepID=UPI003F9FA480
MNQKAIAITGATGSLGADVARQVAAAEQPVRLIVRDAKRAPGIANAEVREAVYQDTDAFAQALEGVDTVFLVSLPESGQRRAYHRSAVEACRRSGLRRIVYTSFINGTNRERNSTQRKSSWTDGSAATPRSPQERWRSLAIQCKVIPVDPLLPRKPTYSKFSATKVKPVVACPTPSTLTPNRRFLSRSGASRPV